MKFGVFDHVDDSGEPLNRHYENRLKIVEAYDHAGFFAYHIAEHHSTPLGFAPSPGIFLSAVAQRTNRLRFGPMVYLLPFYHPIRLIEEICMIDQLSNGRLELGIGRGVSPFEAQHYGLDFGETQRIYHERFQLLLNGLTADELTFSGGFDKFEKVPMVLRPLQRPHPPLWYGLAAPEHASWPAANQINVMMNQLAPAVRDIIDAYTSEWSRLGKNLDQMPLLGVNRHIVVAKSDSDAVAIARRAYAKWINGLKWLWSRSGVTLAQGAARSANQYPDTFEEAVANRTAFAGSPTAVQDYIAREINDTRTNYFVCRLAFGDMSLAEVLTSVELMAESILPIFTRAEAA
jgi:alkanesulfonate monooxygenase SsuD/methylene tetrahydromethanopterin reductase-like flavin-dependent oxidoreductase (luciferase family)